MSLFSNKYENEIIRDSNPELVKGFETIRNNPGNKEVRDRATQRISEAIEIAADAAQAHTANAAYDNLQDYDPDEDC